MRVAALYDVHGNLPALEAVLAEVERDAPDVVLFGGDLIWGAWPRETLELALTLGERARFIRGNTDRGALESPGDSAVWTRERLTPEQRDLVASWPVTLTLDIDGLGATLFCHATPRSDEVVVTPASPDARWEILLDGVTAGVVVCGHTHLQYDERRAGRRIVNPGSIGNPTGRAAAYWALLGPDAELRSTDYDAAGAAAAMRATGFPRTDFADELLQPYSWERAVSELERHTSSTGLYGGAFDPPHLGHVGVAEAAKRHFGLTKLVVLVAEHPGHKGVHAPAEARLELARAAFPNDDVRLDPYPRTIDLLRGESFDDPLFVIGADQFCDFPTWKEPDAVLERTRLAVATRPGFPRERLDAVLRTLLRPRRVLFFDVEPNPAASRDIRGLAAAGEPLDGLVPPAVAALIEERGLYRGD
ncbi:MAG: metallophosphoesterase family protein [Gaiellaceae bacterium]